MRTTLAWGLAVLLAVVACGGDGDDLTGAWGGELVAAADIGTGRPLSADLSGAAEVPGPGDPD